MYLADYEAKTFYKLWLGLLEYTNQKYHVAPQIKEMVHAETLNPQELVPIKNKLWEDKLLIDEYLEEHKSFLSSREIELITNWKRHVGGRFVIIKHLKKYSVFMDQKNGGKLFGVVGISNPIQEMYQLPVYVDAVLLPFNGRIIYDSLMISYNVSFGSGIKAGFNDDYRRIKNIYGIIAEL